MSSNDSKPQTFGYNPIVGPEAVNLSNLNKDEKILSEFNNSENLLNRNDTTNTLSVKYAPTNNIISNSVLSNNSSTAGLQYYEQGEVSTSAYIFMLLEFIKMIVVDCEELEDHDKKLREIGEDVGLKLLELVKFKMTVPASNNNNNNNSGINEKVAAYKHNINNRNKSSLDISPIPSSVDVYKHIVVTSSNSNRNLQTSNTSLRDLQKLNVLEFIHGPLWKYMFGKKADDIQQLKNKSLEYIIIDNEPLISSLVLTSQVNEFISGIIKGVVVNSGFNCDKVEAHVMEDEDLAWPNKTVYVIKFRN